MNTLLDSAFKELQKNPEVKAFIYQQINELEGFVTPNTVVTVMAKDANKLAKQYEMEGVEYDKQELKKMYRVAIVLKEAGATAEAEGIDKNLFVAIQKAKDNLLKQLIEIQNTVISQQDRNTEVHQYLHQPTIH